MNIELRDYRELEGCYDKIVSIGMFEHVGPRNYQVTGAMEDRFLLEDWHNFGPDYDRTLMAWWSKFNAAWPRLKRRYLPVDRVTGHKARIC